jgi:hypothetical protein
MNYIPDPATGGTGTDFDARQAADLLNQATRQARRTFEELSPLLWVYRAVFVLAVFGGCWLTVRGQDPYTGPTLAVLPVAFGLMAINIGWTAWTIRRASAGVSGPAERKRRIWIGVMLLVLVAAYAVTTPLFHAAASHPVWGLYQASAPLLVVGLVGAVAAVALRYWAAAGTLLAIAVIAAAAGFADPATAWLIVGAGLCAVCLGTAASTAWQQRRAVVRP